MVRQLSPEEVDGYFESVANLTPDARVALEGVGVVFTEETEFDEPGPTQWALVATRAGRRYLVVHHYGHPESFVDLRASTEETDPAEAVSAFVSELGLSEADVLAVVPPSEWRPRPR